jgi:ABC-type branched-subunit amino acid transport system ATPase component
VKAPQADQPVLELTGVGKQFGAIRALHAIDMQVSSGEVVGLMGDNGAGKPTLVKIIAGNFAPSSGEILDSKAVHFHRPVDARAVGIEIVYQDLALADNLTAAANVFLGRELGPIALLDHKAMAAEGYKAFVNKNKKDIDAGKFTLVVADTLKMQLKLLRDGYSNALTGQRPFEMGEKSMDALLAIKKGQKVPEIIYTGLDLVTKDNVAQLLK